MASSLLSPVGEFISRHWPSLIALLVSSASLYLSVLNYRRDQPRLILRAQLFDGVELPSYIRVQIVNAGRRPTILLRVWGKGEGAVTIGWSLGNGEAGIKLAENEHHSFKVTHLPRGTDEFDACAMDDDTDLIAFEEMWIEDTLGERHHIPGLETLLPRLQAEYKEWCARTGYWNPPAAQPAD